MQRALWLVLVAVSVTIAVAQAAPPTSESKPFAEHFLALQISDDSADAQDHILSIAANMLEYYGPDRIAIEVVAFGPGIHLLFADNPRAERIASLVSQGVRFDGCMKTIETITRETGKKPVMNPHMTPVDAGVARLLELTENGYTLVRP